TRLASRRRSETEREVGPTRHRPVPVVLHGWHQGSSLQTRLRLGSALHQPTNMPAIGRANFLRFLKTHACFLSALTAISNLGSAHARARLRPGRGAAAGK